MRRPLFAAAGAVLLLGCGLVLDLDPPPMDAGGRTECDPGQLTMEPCGRCGTRTRRCDEAGRWIESACGGEGVCEPGETRGGCAFCPDRQLVCDDACGWPMPPDVCCDPGDLDQTGEGCALGEVRPRSCDAECGHDLGDCAPVADGPFVVLPMGGPPVPARLTLRFTTHVALADVYFLFDESASLSDDRAALVSAIGSVLDARSCDSTGVACDGDDDCPGAEVCSRVLGQCTESPAGSGCVADLWSGVGGYLDDPRNVLSSQPSAAATRAALASLTSLGGVEQLYEAALAMAQPGLVPEVTGCTGPGPDRIGCPAMRADARRLLFVFTDEPNGGPPTAAVAGAALQRQGIRAALFNAAGRSGTRADLEALAFASGSVDAMGGPLVFDVDATTIVRGVENALDDALVVRPQRVEISVYDDPADGVDATQLIDYFETNTSAGGCARGPTEDADGDTHDDTFVAAIPGERLCFDLVARQDILIPELPDPQLFPVIVEVRGDGSPVDRVGVTFVVPGTR